MTKTNAVAWFDIYVEDMDRAVTFYQTVFGVTLEALSDPSGEMAMMSFPMDMGNYGAGGALCKSPHGKPGMGGTIVYFSSEDTAIEEARVADAGGQVVQAKFSIGEFGWISMCIDSEGNMFGIHSMA